MSLSHRNQIKRSLASDGFTLPTVIIVSLIMFGVLALALQLVASSSRGLSDMYVGSLARGAAESGSLFIADCIIRDKFSAGVTITPATDCAGVAVAAQSPYVLQNSRYRTTFSAKYVTSGGSKVSNIVGKVEVLQEGTSTVVSTQTHSMTQQISQEIDEKGSRASKRWWYFGQNAKLDFGVSGTATPKALTTSGAAATAIKAEGTTVVSNRDGDLLFYSDGLTIWDRNGGVMLNSTGLSGSSTATQAVAAFPLNSEEKLYVVISNSVHANSTMAHGELYYSVVDMSANGGLGAVKATAKNIQMGGMRYSSEAIGAVPNLAGDGYWVYTYTPNPVNNKIWGFQIREKPKTDSTYSQNPVLYSGSNLINAYDVNVQDFTYRARICTSPPTPPSMATSTTAVSGLVSMNFNSDYSKMVLYMGGAGCSDTYANAGTVHVLSINRQTGMLSKHASWYARQFFDPASSSQKSAGYSADFSPSGRYVYTSQIYPGVLHRYDISSGNSTTIKSSERQIALTSCQAHLKSELPYNNGSSRTDACITAAYSSGDGGGQVLRGPDNKMYVADRGARHISVINNPDAANASTAAATATNVGWSYAGLPLPSGALSYYGLPQMVSLYSPRVLVF